jgi:hypothetical protein
LTSRTESEEKSNAIHPNQINIEDSGVRSNCFSPRLLLRLGAAASQPDGESNQHYSA